MLQAGRLRLRDPTRLMKFFNLPHISAALVPGIYTASKRNEYQKQENIILGD
jgi:hypothetical protein